MDTGGDRRSGLVEYESTFSKHKTDLGHCHALPFVIRTPADAKPISSRPYRTNPVLTKKVDAIIDSYLAAGLVQHSTSPWSSPVVVVPKPNGDIWITVNYKRLNDITIIPRVPHAHIDELLVA